MKNPKTLVGMIIVDITLIIGSIATIGKGFINFIFVCMAIGGAVYIFLEYNDSKKTAKRQLVPGNDVETERRAMLDKKLDLAKQAIANGKHDVIEEANMQFENFAVKERALINIIKLNEGGLRNTLLQSSMDVYETLVENYTRLSKRVIAYDVTGDDCIMQEMDEIISSNDKLLDSYNLLISETSRAMEDGSNEQSTELQNLVKDLEEMRRKTTTIIEEEKDSPFNLKL